MSQGKYHGKRLSATEVIRLYAAGERDFRGSILRGNNFHKANLSGADFSGADIRSARFVDATLQNTNFSYAMAGVQWQWAIGQWFLIGIIAVLAGLLQRYTVSFIGILFRESPDALADSRAGLLIGLGSIFIVSAIFLIIARQGFTLKALGSVVFAFAVVFAVVFTVNFNSIFLVASATAVAVLSVFAFALFVALAVTLADAGAVTGFCIGTVAVTVNRVSPTTIPAAAAVAGVSLLLFVYINRQIHREDPKFENLRIIGLAFAALGGTSFNSADLSGATFSQAKLKSSNFAASRQRPTILSRVRWHGAQQLDRARLGMANLKDPRVLKLLTTLNGIDQDFSNADLHGANLAGAELGQANLRGANLNGALLKEANLHKANLTEANCIAADFTAAHLTGACLEAWNIDSTTILEDIDCQYVFLRKKPDARGDRERRPHNPDKCFEPGDFEKLFKEMLDTVQLLIRNGINPDSFKAAFQSIIQAHPGITTDSIQSFERQGDDILLTLQVPEGTNKADVERTWDEVYEARLAAATATAQLEAEKRRGDDIKEVSLGFSRFLSSFQINNMNNPINTGDGSFYAGGDVNLTGSTLNLGTISGQVSNQINQIPAPTATDQPSLKDILTRLQTAVETDSELSDEEKAEALQAVGRIATAGAEPNPDAKAKGIVKRASETLKGLAESLTDASQLAEACKTLLPIILSLFALL